MTKIVWKCEDKADFMLSLARVGELLTFARDGKLVSPLSIFMNINEWSGSEIVPEQLMDEARSRVNEVYDGMDRARAAGFDGQAVKTTMDSAEADFDMVNRMVDGSSVIPCMVVVEYDESAEDGERVKTAITAGPDVTDVLEGLPTAIQALSDISLLMWRLNGRVFLMSLGTDVMSMRKTSMLHELEAIDRIIDNDIRSDSLDDAQNEEAMEVCSAMSRVMRHAIIGSVGGGDD